MNRNVESHFSTVPYVDKPRSIFDRSFGHKTSFNCGELVPFYLEQNVLPGDTFRVTTSKVVRMQTLLTPIMDNMYLDTYYFFVPWRLVWTHVREFFGENTTSAWVQTTPYKIPGISAPASTGFASGTIADHFGLPVGVTWSTTDLNCPSALPFRAYALICNEFFRDENLTDPLNIPTGDSDQTGTNGTSYINDVANGGMPFKVAKFHDYFTSCLPSPQKAASPVSLNIVQGAIAPVYTGTTNYAQTVEPHYSFSSDSTKTNPFTSTNNLVAGWIKNSSNQPDWSPWIRANGKTGNVNLTSGTSGDTLGWSAANNNLHSPIVDNYYADLTGAFGSVTVNELRLAFQLQRYYERLARGGSRYIEFCKSFFGAVSSDARLQRPEYLGGNRVPININQVINNAQSANDYLGDLGAMSQTADIHEDFVKSFTEHGIIIGLMCVRYDHTYSQGINRAWMRRTLEQQYNPVFANLGESPVFKAEIYANGLMNSDDVFGYQEAWADYRYMPDICSGEMRPAISNTLASWHLADNYNSAPTLSDGWIREDKTNVDRVLAVTSSVANQFWADIHVKNIATRVMPMFSVPGLIDHM